MRKLNNRKIRWIIREKEKGELTNEKIAQTQHITPRRVRQLWREYKKTEKPITYEEMIMVMDAYREYKAGAVLLEAIIMKRHGRSIPHNRIHRIHRKLKKNTFQEEDRFQAKTKSPIRDRDSLSSFSALC